MHTQSEFKRAHAKALKRRQAASDAVFASALPRTDIRFNDCLAMASDAVRDEYDAAFRDLLQIESDAISAGVAYPGAFGRMEWTIKPCRRMKRAA